MTADDSVLLAHFVADRDEEAFAELVRRYLNLVYFAALRQVGGDAHRAEDVAQTVFTRLARKAESLTRHQALAGWLHTTTRFAAREALRAERRRLAREEEAHTMHELTTDSASAADWEKLRPVIDEVLSELGDDDREAVLLRFFAEQPLAAIGARLQVSENAARMRVDRALDKLHGLLAKRGVTSTAAALGLLLANQAAAVTPAGLAASVTNAALAGSALATGGGAVITAKAFTSMSTTKIMAGVAGLVAIAATVITWQQWETNAELRRENVVLREAKDRAKPLLPPAVTTMAEATHAAQVPRAEETNTLAATSKARGEVSPPAEARGMASVENWQNRGTTTPAGALETYLWAADRVDVDVMANAIAFGKLKPKIDTFYASLSDDIRARFDSPEKLWAFVLQGAPHAESERVTAFELLSQTELPDNYVSLRMRVLKGDRMESGNMLFERTPNGWRRTLGDPDRGDSLIAPVIAMFPPAQKPDGEK